MASQVLSPSNPSAGVGGPVTVEPSVSARASSRPAQTSPGTRGTRSAQQAGSAGRHRRMAMLVPVAVAAMAGAAGAVAAAAWMVESVHLF